MFVKHSDEVEVSEVTQGKDVTRQVFISAEEAPNFAMRRFTIQPGGSMPNHTNLVEHEQFVLRGQADVGMHDTVFKVKKGDVVFIPADVPHWYTNTGDEPFEFLCMVPNKEDVTTILE